MSLRERLDADIHDAMRGHHRTKLGALRFLKSQIQLVEKTRGKPLDDSGILEAIAKQAKDRRDSLKMFEQGNRSDLVAKESADLAVLEEYLPPQLSHEELAQLVKEVIKRGGGQWCSGQGPGDGTPDAPGPGQGRRRPRSTPWPAICWNPVPEPAGRPVPTLLPPHWDDCPGFWSIQSPDVESLICASA